MKREERLNDFGENVWREEEGDEQRKIKLIEHDLALLEGMNEMLLKSLE